MYIIFGFFFIKGIGFRVWVVECMVFYYDLIIFLLNRIR